MTRIRTRPCEAEAVPCSRGPALLRSTSPKVGSAPHVTRVESLRSKHGDGCVLLLKRVHLKLMRLRGGGGGLHDVIERQFEP
jgi:hypothetical protein